MHDDFGDDAGEKLIDWMVRIGETAGSMAAVNAAKDLKTALANAKDEISGEAQTAIEKATQWAKLDMAEFKKIEGWPELKELISDKLSACGITHEYLEIGEEGKTYLIFKADEANLLAEAFNELVEQTDLACNEVEGILSQTRVQEREQAEQMKESREGRSKSNKTKDSRDSEALESKAEIACKASAELEHHDHGLPERELEIGREQVRAR